MKMLNSTTQIVFFFFNDSENSTVLCSVASCSVATSQLQRPQLALNSETSVWVCGSFSVRSYVLQVLWFLSMFQKHGKVDQQL